MEEDKSKILKKINKAFFNKKVAVRSSSYLEDSFIKSNAGAFESVLNVHTKEKSSLINAINTVIESYSKNGPVKNLNNQVLVQEMVSNVMISSVVLQRI